MEKGVIGEVEDIFYLRLQELDDAVREGRVDERLIRERQAEFRFHRTLTPPRVITSDGKVCNGSYRRGDLPAGAIAGLPVFAGTVEEGRASSRTSIAPTCSRATSSSPPSPTPAGRPSSSRPPVW